MITPWERIGLWRKRWMQKLRALAARLDNLSPELKLLITLNLALPGFIALGIFQGLYLIDWASIYYLSTPIDRPSWLFGLAFWGIMAGNFYAYLTVKRYRRWFLFFMLANTLARYYLFGYIALSILLFTPSTWGLILSHPPTIDNIISYYESCLLHNCAHVWED